MSGSGIERVDYCEVVLICFYKWPYLRFDSRLGFEIKTVNVFKEIQLCFIALSISIMHGRTSQE